jgi:hypothetical protein
VRALRAALLPIMGVALLVSGCLPRWVPKATTAQGTQAATGQQGTGQTPPAPESSVKPPTPDGPTPPSGTSSGTKGGKLSDQLLGGSSGGADGGAAGLPNLNTADFALDGYEAQAVGEADTDGDGTNEGLIAFQYGTVDEVGEPLKVAYVSVVRWDGSAWQEWAMVHGENDERFADNDSLVRAGDINGDGTPELIVRFYGFGVSGRPENVYVYHLADDGTLTSIVQGGCAQLTSKDGFAVADVDKNTPGPELLFAFAQPDQGPEAGPHAFALEVHGWTGSQYEYVSGKTTSEKYASGADAIAAAYGA